MPIISINNVVMPAATATTIANNLDNSVNAIIALAEVNLTKAERNSMQTIADERFPYVDRAINLHATNNPRLVPSYISLADAKRQYDLMMALRPLLLRSRKLTEIIEDLSMLSSSNAYTFLREFYANVQRAKENNIAGADSVYEDLKGLFEAQRSSSPSDTPPNPA